MNLKDIDPSSMAIAQAVLRKSKLANVIASPSAINKLHEPLEFNIELPDVKPTDQKRSGRCWLFAALNVIRRKLITAYDLEEDFQLSQAYLFRADRIERCYTAIQYMEKLSTTMDPLHLRTLIDIIMTDGGTWPMFLNLVKKYGLMPVTAFPDNAQAQNTDDMNMLLNTIIRTPNMSADAKINACNKIATAFLGTPPTTLSFKNQTFTPLQFYKKIVKPKINVESFISVVHDPRHPFGKMIRVEHLNNMIGAPPALYLNLDLDTIRKAIKKSLKTKKCGVWFACDVNKFWLNDHKTLNSAASTLHQLLGIPELDPDAITKAEAMKEFVTVPSHAMVICGMSDSGRFKVENSHGTATHTIVMSDDWFSKYAILFALPLAKTEQKQVAGKEIVVPFYDTLGVVAN